MNERIYDDLAGKYVDVSSCFGPAGQEQTIAAKIRSMAKSCAEDISVDALGNVLVHKRGPGPRLMLDAHMDTVGVVVTHLEDDGSARFAPLGDLSPYDLQNALVKFENGTTGTIKCTAARENKLTEDNLYLDVGAGSKEEVACLVNVGDAAVFATKPIRTGRRLMGPDIGSRISCVVLLQAMEQIQAPYYDTWFAFTVQGTVGFRGLTTAAYAVEPEYALTVDAVPTLDFASQVNRGRVALGGGPAIKVMEKSAIAHYKTVELLSDLAKECKLETQTAILPQGKSSVGLLSQTRNGVITGGISIPCRYPNTPTGFIDLSDVASGVELLVSFLENKLNERL